MRRKVRSWTSGTASPVVRQRRERGRIGSAV